MSRIYPNPVKRINGDATIDLSSSCSVIFDWGVYTLAYRRVCGGSIVVNGSGKWIWNLRDSSGKCVSPGLYFVRTKAGKQEILFKLLVK
jgi:hypothetical protein